MLKGIYQMSAWIVLMATAAGNYLFAAVFKAMGGMSLPFDLVASLQPMVGVFTLLGMLLLRLSGWQRWRAACVAAGAQALMFVMILYTLSKDVSTPLEWTVTIASLILGAAAWLAGMLWKINTEKEEGSF